MKNSGNEELQRKVTQSAISQFGQNLIDHNTVEAGIDGLTHYHQGIVIIGSPTDLFYGGLTDDFRTCLIHRTETDLSELAIAQLIQHVPDAKNVLDIGCGRFGTGVLYAKKSLNSFITGVDICRMSIDYAKKIPYVKSRPEAFNLIAGNFLGVDFEDNSFQAIMAIESLQYTTDLLTVFKKWETQLSKRGCAIIAQTLINGCPSEEEVSSTFTKITRVHPHVGHSFKDFQDAASATNFELIEMLDLTREVTRYWELRQGWGFGSCVDGDILNGYRKEHLSYKLMVFKPTSRRS